MLILLVWVYEGLYFTFIEMKAPPQYFGCGISDFGCTSLKSEIELMAIVFDSFG
jgi:hypothetical protein